MAKITEQHVKWAQQVQSKYGVPASVTLGQFIYESGAGTSNMAKVANNGFGVKGSGDAGSYESRGSSWAKYSSMEQSFMAYGQLLQKDRYTQYTKTAKTSQEYLQGLVKGGYCNDSDYVSNVMSIIKSNDLEKYNTGASFSGSSTTENTSSNDAGFFENIAINITKICICLVLVILCVLFISQSFGG